MTIWRAPLAVAGLIGALLLTACATPGGGEQPGDVVVQGVADGVPRLRVVVLGELPHDHDAFTEGLELHGAVLYEGTGRTGSSEIRALDPATGRVQHAVALPASMFGEGITVVGDRIWQLTYTEGVAFERDAATLAERRRVDYSGQGWGLCYDDAGGADRLVMSNGTDQLTFRDPTSFAASSSVGVRIAGRPLADINELECVDGVIWANIWKTDWLVRIDPGTGDVTAAVDAAGLLPAPERSGTDVLNGIAALPTSGEFLLTGKLWPTMFRVRFTPD